MMSHDVGVEALTCCAPVVSCSCQVFDREFLHVKVDVCSPQQTSREQQSVYIAMFTWCILRYAGIFITHCAGIIIIINA